MTAAPTTSNTRSGLSDSDTAELLAELTSIDNTVWGRGWASGDLGGGSGELGQLAATDSPLSALSNAGFDNVRQLVSFLE